MWGHFILSYDILYIVTLRHKQDLFQKIFIRIKKVYCTRRFEVEFSYFQWTYSGSIFQMDCRFTGTML